MPNIRHYREWHFATIKDLRQWELNNRDEIAALGATSQFSVRLESDRRLPRLLDNATVVDPGPQDRES